jgi:hypothetical protein
MVVVPLAEQNAHRVRTSGAQHRRCRRTLALGRRVVASVLHFQHYLSSTNTTNRDVSKQQTDHMLRDMHVHVRIPQPLVPLLD